MSNAEFLIPSLHILETAFSASNPIRSLYRSVYLCTETQVEIGKDSDCTSFPYKPARLDSYRKRALMSPFCSMCQHVAIQYSRQHSSSRALARVIKCSLQFGASQIQPNLQKSDYDNNWEVDKKVMELAKVNMDEKKICHESVVQSNVFCSVRLSYRGHVMGGS